MYSRSKSHRFQILYILCLRESFEKLKQLVHQHMKIWITFHPFKYGKRFNKFYSKKVTLLI